MGEAADDAYEKALRGIDAAPRSRTRPTPMDALPEWMDTRFDDLNEFKQAIKTQPTEPMNAPTSRFKKAVRSTVKLKILLTGASNSGKTSGALAIACGMFPGEVAGIDTENGRMEYYADKYDFHHCPLDDVTPAGYIQAIDDAVNEGFKVLVIDSTSHSWNDLLERKNNLERATPGSNSYVNWGKFGGEWDKLVKHILAAPIHVIATARSKQAYEQVKKDNGKVEVVKLGMEPQVRNGTEYEFAVVFDLNQAHVAKASKDNTGLFDGEDTLWNLRDPKIGTMLHEWLTTAKPVALMTDAQRAELEALTAGFTPEMRAGVMDGLKTEKDAAKRIDEVKAFLEAEQNVTA